MKLSISNIAWAAEYDTEMYAFLSEKGFDGIEIAPTRIFPDNPYDKLEEAKLWAENIKKEYNLSISSMQSIWYGRKENIFSSKKEQKSLLEYTKKAILFAESLQCNNLVFGCPRNRDTDKPFSKTLSESKVFFYEIGEFANTHNTVFAIEANPIIYNTHFINFTKEAFSLVQEVACEGLKVNLDLGTIIYNEEDISILVDYPNLVNHVHISEPNLKKIECRKIHNKLMDLLKMQNYQGFISIEMGLQTDINIIKGIIHYVMELAK